MAHETHHPHESHHPHHPADNRPTTSFQSSFWFVIILVGLFIAAVNFVGVMGHDEGGHGDPHGKTGAAQHPQEATSSQTLSGEDGGGVPATHTTHGAGAGTDSTHVEGH